MLEAGLSTVANVQDLLRLPGKEGLQEKQSERNAKKKKGPSVNKQGERVNKGRVLNTKARMKHLKAHNTEEEE